MLELLKKTAYTGLGLAFMTQDKIRDVARDLSQKAKLSEDDGRKLADELNVKASEARSQFEERIANAIQAAVAKIPAPCTSRLTAIEERLAAIEEALKAKHSKPATDA